MSYQHFTLLPAILLVLAAVPAARAAEDAVKMTRTNDRVRVEINGQLFTEYVFKGTNHVYFYPLLGPGGLSMTRDYPMKTTTEGEEHDHQHHRSLWFSHGAVNGVDFWAETPKAGKILHENFLEVAGGAESGVIRSANRWVAPDGNVVCTDERTFRVYARPNTERLFDFEITIKAGQRDVVFGDTKEGSMAIRVAETMRLTRGKKTPGKGRIVLSTGVRDQETWGKRADWCDYSGPVQGKTVGIAMFNHPFNPVHPTPWHVRDYGLFAANPFGIHDFEKKAPGTGNLVIPARKSVTFRYRIYLHEGDEKNGKVAERWAEYAAAAKAMPAPPAPAPPKVGTGTGLKGEYYNTRDLNGPLIASRVDGKIQFGWGGNERPPKVNGENFSVRWTGQVMASQTGTTSFYTISDDGVRLWVNNRGIIDNWADHGPTENNGDIALEAGKLYDLKLEYFQGGGGGQIELGWEPPGGDRAVLPITQLYPPVK